MMRFRVSIRAVDGNRRQEEFESRHDATAVLEDQIRRDILKPGEEIVTRPSIHDRKTTVPDIERIA